jgi:hypothetical protein
LKAILMFAAILKRLFAQVTRESDAETGRHGDAENNLEFGIWNLEFQLAAETVLTLSDKCL